MRRGTLIAVLLLGVSGAAFAASPIDIWLNVPFVQQERDGCGAASISMVMEYWQQHEGQSARGNSDYGHILRALRSDSAHGIYASDMERYFQENGYRVFAFAGAWADLEHQLEKGRPPIVALKPGPSLHYAVVVGIDDAQRLVLLNDPAQRKLLKEDRSRFEREWKATGYWTLLALPSTSER